MKSYFEMLEEAYKKLPKVIETTDRYKLPELEIEQKGNKTIVRNIYKILELLRRNEKDFGKTFSRILGVPISFVNKELVINALINKQILEKKLNEYVKKYVICDVCKKPETIIEKENEVLILKCLACGYKKILRD